MLYGLGLSFLYQRDKEAVLLWIAGIISLNSLYYFSYCQAICHLIYLDFFLYDYNNAGDEAGGIVVQQEQHRAAELLFAVAEASHGCRG